MNQNKPMPIDTYLENRVKKQTEVVSGLLKDDNKVYKFLHLDRKVLRFYCVWDDRMSKYGEVREFVRFQPSHSSFIF